MSDPREALVQAMLDYDAVDANRRMQVPTARGWAEHVANSLLAEFLVVRRSELDGTEYGWRESRNDQICPRADVVGALLTAQLRGGEAVERPAVPWSVILSKAVLDGD